MSEIDKLEIKIVADAADAEKAVKKLSKSIDGIGKTGDSTKQIREIKSVLESIKTPEIEINGIKEFAKQARTIAHNFSKAARSAKEIGVALKGVNLGQLTKKSKNLKMDGIAKVNTKMLNVSRGKGVKDVLTAEQKRWRDIPVFDMGKQINGKLIQDAAKSMSVYTAETENAESATKNLISTMKKFPQSTGPVIDQNKRLAESAMEFEMSYAREREAIDAQERAQNGDKRGRQTSRRKTSNKSIGRSLGSLFGRSGGRNSFSLPKMVGMSVLYSTVFQLISTIQSAFTEGMQSLAQYSQSVNANISSMMSALMQLRNAFAAAFEPILSVVAPYLATFISWLARAINALGQFFAALTGKGYAVQAKKVQMDYASGFGGIKDGANEAAQAIKNMYSLGFDELHIIDDDKGTPTKPSSTKDVGLGPTDMFETVEIDSKIKGLADRIKEAFKTGDFYSLGADLGKKLQDALGSIDWDAIYEKASNFGTGLATFLNGLITPETFSVLGFTIASALNTALYVLNNFGDNFKWDNFGLSIADGINTFFSTFKFELAADTANKWINGILTTLIKAVQGTDWTMIGEKIGTFIKEIDFIDILSNIGTLIFEAIMAAIKAWNGFVDVAPIESTIIAAVALLKFTGLGASIAKAIAAQIAGSEIVTGIGTAIAGLGPKIAGFILSPWGLAIGAAILAVFMTIKHWDEIKEFLAKLWDGIKKTVVEVWDSIKNFFKTTWDEIVSYYPEKWNELKTATSELWEAVKTTISEKWTAIKNFFTETIPQIIGDIVKWFSELPSKIGTAISTLISSIFPTWGNDISTWISSSIPEKIKMIIDLFKGIPQGVYNAVTSMGRTIEKIGKWMWEGIKKGLLSLVPSGVKEVVSGILSGTKSAAEIHSPSKLFKREVGAYIGAGIVDGMEESVKGAGSVIDEIVDKASGGGSLAPVVSVEAPDISQWDATWATLRENFAVLKADIISSMNTFYSTISDMTTNFGTVSKAQITAYLLKVYDNIYNTFDAIRQTLQQVSDEVTRMLNQMVSDANSLAGLTGKKYSNVGGYTMQQAQRFNIEMFANGGFLRSGELFVAREAGAEMVGSIGGKAAVANNDQIERAIFNAVLTAMSQAMANGSSQPIELNQKIELDGDVIYNNQQRVSARRGINFGLGAFQR